MRSRLLALGLSSLLWGGGALGPELESGPRIGLAAPAAAASAAKPTPAPQRFLEAYNPAAPLVLGVGKVHIVRYADGVFQAQEDAESRNYTFRKPGMKLAEVLRVVRALGPLVEAHELSRNGASVFYTRLNAAGPGGFSIEAKGEGDRFDEVTYSEFWE